MFLKSRRFISKVLVTITMLSIGIVVESPYKVLAASDATINLSQRYQTIKGFGGMNHPSWAGDLTASQRETAFGNGNNQLGFSVLRIHVDENRNNWSKELATAKAAVEKGAIVFASPWNPPSNMTETFNRNGKQAKRLRHDKYADYAKHLNDFVNYMKSNGVNLYAISIANEPDYGHTWTWWTANEVLNFMKNNAGSINCKVIAPESFSYKKDMSDPILNDSRALANLDILGAHLYGTSYNNFSYPLFQQKGRGKELWMTEVYYPNSNNNSADKWPEALDVSYHINKSMTNGFQTYVWWYIRRSYSPMKENGTISKRGYCMAQFSKFIRPGYTRVGATENPNNNVTVSAYTGNGKVVVVAINKGGSVNQKFVINNGSVKSVESYRTSGNENLKKTSNINTNGNNFTANLPSNSVTTFVCSLGSAGHDNPGDNPGEKVTIKDGWYYIKSVNSQKYLQVKNDTGKNTANIEIGTGTGKNGQRWYLRNLGDGYITLKSALGDFMIDVANGENKDGANIQLYKAYSGTAQQFMVKTTSQNNIYVIATKSSNGTKGLDVYGNGTADGTNVCQWTLGQNKRNQQWKFEEIR